VHATNVQQVAVTTGGDQTCSLARAAEQRVDADGVPVHDLRDVGDVQTEFPDALQHPLFLLRGGEHLPVADLARRAVEPDDVRERAAHIDPDGPFAHTSLAFDIQVSIVQLYGHGFSPM
jgi:hypothetical protein